MARNNQKCVAVIAQLKEVWPNFDIHLEDLNNPTAASVYRFFEKLFVEMGVDIEKITTTLSQCLSAPDAYQEILHFYVMYRCSRGFLERLKINLEPSKLSDILQPTMKSTKIKVMAISNFLFYAHNLIAETLHPIENRVRAKVVDLNTMKKEFNELGTKTNTLAIEYSALHTEQNEIQKEIEETFQAYVQQMKINEIIEKDNDNLKKESSELDAERSRLMETLRREMAKETELKQLIVEDSDIITSDCERLQKEIAEEELYATDAALNLERKKDTEKKYLAATATVNKFLEQEPLESVLALYETRDTLQTSLEKMEESLHGMLTVEANFHSTFRQMQEETDSLQEELQAMQLQQAAKQSAMQQELELLEAERAELASKKTRNDGWAKEFEEKIQHAIECCGQHERNMDTLNKFYQSEYNKIMQSTGEFHQKIGTNLKEMKQKSEHLKLSFLSTSKDNSN